MCLTETSENSYKCCCCFPMVVGVVFIIACEVFSLVSSIQLLDIVGIVFSTAMLVMFGVTCFTDKARKWLLMLYLVSFIGFIIQSVVYFVTEDATKIITRICGAISKQFFDSSETCDDTISDIFWWVVAIMSAIVFVVKLWCSMVLYYYYKEKEVCSNTEQERDAQGYHNLQGHRRDN